jgi:predicted HicB family RNase H-like nuclease
MPGAGGVEQLRNVNKMKVGGYTAQIEYSEEDGLLIGHIAGIKDIVGFQG